jgi:L-amino acid N-acyltransferase YncA
MDLHIRLAIDPDLPAITEIYNQAIALQSATAHTSPVTIDSRRSWLAEHSADKYPVFVAANQDNLAGYCSISPYRPGRMALRHTAEISYYVHENVQGKGVGTRLIEYAIEQCPRLEVRTLFAILLEVNSDSAAILEKFGFEKWGHLPRVADFDGTEYGHLYYGRRISV